MKSEECNEADFLALRELISWNQMEFLFKQNSAKYLCFSVVCMTMPSTNDRNI
jgi:hypothetical protein